MELFEKTDSDRTMNILDNIVVEDALRNQETADKLKETRARLNKNHGRIGSGAKDGSTGYSGGSQLNYIQPTERGYQGLEAPLG